MTTITPETIGAMLRLVLTVALVWLAWERMLLPTLRDVFKAQLFDLRRRLFLYAAEGNIAHNHVAYVRLRSAINGLLTTADDLTFGRLWLYAELLPNPPPNCSGWLQQAFEQVDDSAVHKDLTEFRSELELALGLYLLLSPLAWAFLFGSLVKEGSRLALTRLAERVPAVAAGHEEGDWAYVKAA